MSQVMLRSSQKTVRGARARTTIVCNAAPKPHALKLAPVLLASVLALNGGLLSAQSAQAISIQPRSPQENLNIFQQTKQNLRDLKAQKKAGTTKEERAQAKASKAQNSAELAAQSNPNNPPAMAEIVDGSGKVKTAPPTAVIPKSAR